MYPASNGQLYYSDVTDSSTWVDYDVAVDYAEMHNLNIGFVLSDHDPYTCIDLDVVDAESQQAKGQIIDDKKWTNEVDFNRYDKIINAFDSYTEKSLSGKGWHIWLKGDIGTGRRRDSVEVYSVDRFIICTGNVDRNRPISNDKILLLSELISEMDLAGNPNSSRFELIEIAEEASDEEIWNRAANADNSDKFEQLVAGEWQQLGYPSQSEADLALMSMFTFYSPSNAQCMRLFRKTRLGERNKAVKNDKYLRFTLEIIRGRQSREKTTNQAAEELAKSLVASLRIGESVNSDTGEITTISDLVSDMQNRSRVQVSEAVVSAREIPLPEVLEGELAWPPGIAGAIAGFIYQSANRPIKEVAIVSALGFLAGVCGKSFCIPHSGLNLYVILIARSGVGKEAMHNGLGALMRAIQIRCPAAMQFVNFNEFASGQALIKAVAENPCFVSVMSEWGKRMKTMAKEGVEGPSQTLRTAMTALYQKSGPDAIVGGITYSNKENNIRSVGSVSYSMVGETTPKTLYQSLTETMMEDGFLSRFLIVEYDGGRPPENIQMQTQPDSNLADALAQLCQQSIGLIGRNQHQPIEFSPEARYLLKQFDLECDNQINSSDDEGFRQMWNRAALKALRISGLLAAADNFIAPCVSLEHAEWALSVVRKDISSMHRRIYQGDVGSGDNSRERKVLAIAADYVKRGAAAGYQIPQLMQVHGIIPRKYLQIRTAKLTTFCEHRSGSTLALEGTLQSLVASGYFMRCDKTKVIEQFGFHGECYRILDVNM